MRFDRLLHSRARAVRTLLVAAGWLLVLGAPDAAHGASRATARVALVVDTSASMTEPGMDPERTSLLVARLFADIVPGELAVIRLPDLVGDADLLPSRPTGRREPCPDDPSRTCEVVEPAGDWEAIARSERLGALARPRRGDPEFKRRLDDHLQPRGTESKFVLSFRAAQGFLDEHAAEAEAPETVVWLSDGRPEDAPALRRILAELAGAGARVEAIVFGRGDTSLARQAGLEVRQVSEPAELMAAFADVFRRVVEAPYGVDGRVREKPSFEMQPQVDEAWVVVYGNATLSDVRLEGPSGSHRADHGGDRHPPAGAYRIAYLPDPSPGLWTVHAEGGGPEAAYAVIQRSSLAPALLAPKEAVAGVATTLVAGVRGGEGEDLITVPEVLETARLTAEVAGSSLPLEDRGGPGDEVAGDGRFGGIVRLDTPGNVPVRLRLVTDLVDRWIEATIAVTGFFRYTGGPVAVDLGHLRAGEEACRPVRFEAEHRGALPFRLKALRDLPGGHRLELRRAGLAKPLVAGGAEAPLAPGMELQLCLVTAASAPSSEAEGEPWLALTVAGGEEATRRVPLAVTWELEGLSFWERWWKLLLGLLLVLLALFVASGYILPHRFPAALAVTFVPIRDELDEQSPQPVRQWKGVGIGFYRHARAFLHPDYRLSGSPRGALAGLHAEGRSTRVSPGKGTTLYREALDGGWEDVASAGRTGRAGDVYRVGQDGPFFRIGSRR